MWENYVYTINFFIKKKNNHAEIKQCLKNECLNHEFMKESYVSYEWIEWIIFRKQTNKVKYITEINKPCNRIRYEYWRHAKESNVKWMNNCRKIACENTWIVWKDVTITKSWKSHVTNESCERIKCGRFAVRFRFFAHIRFAYNVHTHTHTTAI